jgi:hypothetical protein
VYWDSSVVFFYHAFIGFGGNPLLADLSSFAVLFPSSGFLLDVGYLVSNRDLRCIVALAGITAYLAIPPITEVRTYVGLTVLVLAFALGNFLVACICTWCYFLGV